MQPTALGAIVKPAADAGCSTAINAVVFPLVSCERTDALRYSPIREPDPFENRLVINHGTRWGIEPVVMVDGHRVQRGSVAHFPRN